MVRGASEEACSRQSYVCLAGIRGLVIGSMAMTSATTVMRDETMTSKTKSQLQLAADRVREMQVAIEKSEKNFKVCQEDLSKAEIKIVEAKRNYDDTLTFLRAQREKLERSLQEVRNLVGSYSSEQDMCKAERHW